MNFPREYFYDEVRESFYISGMMKRSWAAQIEVLEEIDLLCQKHGILWFADCGTLLGAVRHGGYVPWDDDLDICMLRDDYKRFHKYVVPELPEKYVTLTYENEEYWQMITRVVNRDGISFAEDDLKKYHGFPYTAGIDVFVLDYVAQDPGEEEVRRQLVNTILSIGNIPGIDGDNPSEEGVDMLQMVEETYHVQIDRKNHLCRQLYEIAERLSCLYPSEGAKEVVLMPYWCSEHNHKYPIETVNKIARIPFENTLINVPAGYDKVLKIEYGDYLKIHRGGAMHDYPLYQVQEDYLAEKWGINNPYLYIFDKKDLKKEKMDKPARLKNRFAGFCELLHQIHKMICNSEVDTDQALELLEQSQEGIISIGEDIEEQYGEGYTTVNLIERYCEDLYIAAQTITEGEMTSLADVMKKLDDTLGEMELSIKNDLKEKKEILFISFRSELWDTFRGLYRKALKDENVNVTVMPVPYYDKDVAGKIGDMHYDIDGYPKDIKLADYRKYDVEKKHPDIIYTMYAYDAYNYTYVLPPMYFTSELKKHTEELVYVPYFKLGKIVSADQKLRQTTRYFVKIPGMMHADKVLLESEEIRKLYFEELVSFCGEDTSEIWEEKLKVMEEKKDFNDPDIKIPAAWNNMLYKTGGDKKKTVLFLNAICSFYQYKERALEKLAEVLETFKNTKEDVLLIWRPQPVIALSEDLFTRELWLKYRQIVEEYRASGWGILDENADPQMAIDLADAYYGDPDPVMQKCRVAGKPVMIMDVDVN